jgi:hypothetical protein
MTTRSELTELINDAAATAGNSGPKIADRIIGIAYPETIEAAKREGCETYLRRGLIAHISRYLRRTNATPTQIDLSDVHPSFQPIARRLKSSAYYVPSIEEYVGIADLIGSLSQLNEARGYMRLKGVQCLAEARTLDQLYEAATDPANDTVATEVAA